MRNCVCSLSVFVLAICIDVFCYFFWGRFRATAQLWAAQIWQQQSMFCYKREFITAAAAARQAEGAAAARRRVSNEQAWPVSVHCARSREQTPAFTLAIDLGHSYTLFKETFAAAAVTNGWQISGVNIHLLSPLILHSGLQVALGAVRSFRPGVFQTNHPHTHRHSHL